MGGRYSALTAFGLVPSGLAGADVEALLDDAEAVADLLAADDEANPALRLGAAMAGTEPLRDKLVLVDAGTENVGFGAWAEQLIAESTGKDGTGILPVVAIGTEPAHLYDDGTVVRLVASDDDDRRRRRRGAATRHPRVTVAGPLGAQLLLWEAATAVAGRLLGINPFDQPDVESAKSAARELLDAGIGAGDGAGVHRRRRRGARPRRRLARRRHHRRRRGRRAARPARRRAGYVAVMAYLDREADADLEHVARDLFDRTGRPRDLRLGPAVPALHRAVPQGRARRPASTCRSPRHPARTSPSRAATSPSASSSPRRPVATPRCSPTTAAPSCACTSPPTTPGWPRCGRRSAGAAGEPGARRRGRQPAARPPRQAAPRIAGPCWLVLFGVTGDLARKKLMPAIYDLANRGLLPPGFSLVGFARRDWADQDFGKIVYESVRERARTPFREDVWR